MIVGVVGFGSLDLPLPGPRPGGYLQEEELGSHASRLLRGSSRLRVWIGVSNVVQINTLAVFI